MIQITVSGQTMDEIRAALIDVGRAICGPSKSAAPAAPPPATPPAAQAASGVVGPKCPTHGRNRLGKAGIHCPAKMPDGSYCTWTAAAP